MSWASFLICAAVPRLRRTLQVYARPKPKEPPEGYRVWPLRFVGAAFVVTRQAGALLALGLALDALFPLRISLL